MLNEVMEDSEGSSNGPPPFLTKTYEMVEEPSTDCVVSWSQNGFSFVVWNPPEFARDLLPIYFKHNNFSSFVRQLNTYGFRKMDREQWEFANDDFIRGRRDLLKNIYRRKPVHSHSMLNQVRATPLPDRERQEFEEKIKRLKHENILLEMKFQNHQRENEEFGYKIQTLYQKLGQVENRQKKLVSLMAEQIQKPGLKSKFIENTESQSRKRRLSKSKTCPNEICLQGKYPDSESNTMAQIEKLESYLRFCEAFLQEISEVMQDPETNGAGAEGTCSFPSSDSSPPLYLEDRFIDRTISLYIDEILISKTQSVPQIEFAREATAEVTDSLQTGVNDGFWEQFLRETPATNLS